MNINEYLGDLHDQCLELCKQLRFDKQHKLHFALVSLYGSIIELVGCMLILIKNNAKLGIPSLFRTFLETFVEFHNLVRDPKYGYYMEASFFKEWLRVLNVAREAQNPYLSGISSLPNLPAIISDQESQLHDLKTRGYKPLIIREKFKRANMLEVYTSFYNFLCTESHSNKRALINRHMNISANGYELVFYKNEPDNRYLCYTDFAAGLLVSATVSIHDYLESPARSQVKDFQQQLDSIRSRYQE
jgi:hypothetical protein